MAIYWVDPHIGAAVQANGTTSTTIRDGSYASPWSLADVSSTSQTTLPTKMAPLVSGDEIRFKGLPINTYTFALPNTTFRTNQAFGGANTEFRTNGVLDSALITTDYVGTGATIWPRILYVDSIPALNNTSGFIPAYQISNQTTYFLVQGGSTWQPGYGYTAMGTNTFTARMVKYKEYGIDVQTLIGTTFYMLPRLASGVKVTAGWTSDTVRDGVTLILMWSAATSTPNWCNQSTTYSNTTGWFDCPELFLIHGAKGTNQIDGRFRVGSGGNGTTSVLGGVINSYGSSNNIAYAAALASLEVKYGYHTAYGWSTSGTNLSLGNRGTLILTNTIGGYQNGYSSISTSYVDYKIGNYHCGSNDTSTAPWQVSNAVFPNTAAPTYEVLPNSIITAYGASCKAVTNYLMAYLTVGSGVTNTFTGRNVGVGTYPGTAERPVALQQFTGTNLASMKLSPTFVTNILISTYISNMNEGLAYIGELDTDGVDYKTVTTCAILDNYTSVVAAGQSRSYVYQSNSYDGRPIMLMLSGDHFPCLLYNDSSKDEALAWHQVIESATKFYQKDIPVAIPAYTTEQVNVQAVYSTSATFNGSMVMELWTVNSQTGVPTLQGNVTVNSGNLSSSQLNVTLSNSTLTSNNIKTAYLRMKFTGGTNGGQKFWLQSVTATLPTP